MIEVQPYGATVLPSPCPRCGGVIQYFPSENVAKCKNGDWEGLRVVVAEQERCRRCDATIAGRGSDSCPACGCHIVWVSHQSNPGGRLSSLRNVGV